MEEDKIVPVTEEVKEEQVIEKDNEEIVVEEIVVQEEKVIEETVGDKIKNNAKKARRRFKKLFIHEVTAENDIKYRGPLSYRHLRILGWIFLTIASIGILLGTAANLYKNENMFGPWPSILAIFKDMMGPLFLTATFATVIVAKDGYRRLIILHSGLSILLFLLFLLAYQHYMVGIFTALDPEGGRETSEFILLLASGNGFMAFNIFIDLLLCTLATCFINYTPKTRFQGKKIYIFRSFVAIPILYELASITLKMLCSTGVIFLPPLVYPLLTTKAPIAFFIFIFMAIFIKKREKFFIKKGKTHEDYLAFQNTNLNSFQFSKTLTFAIIVASVIDIVILFALTSIMFANTQIPEGIQEIDIYASQLEAVFSWGFGQTAPLLLIIPIILLFDYRKTYNTPLIDLLIPIAGILLMLIVYLEGSFQIVRNYLIDARNAAEKEEGQPQVAQLAIKFITFIKSKIK